MEGERNTTSHDQEELHVIGEEVGVAGLQNSANDDSMGSNGSRYSRCNGSLDKRHMFGVALLVIVDLIWVGSAGLTKVGTGVSLYFLRASKYINVLYIYAYKYEYIFVFMYTRKET